MYWRLDDRLFEHDPEPAVHWLCCTLTRWSSRVAPPGDLMSTGTWGGTGIGRAPQEFLHRFPFIGDSVYTRTEVLGLQANSVTPGRAPTGLAAQRMITIDQ